MADFLHDGPIQELSAAILELQLLRRSAAPDRAPGLDRALGRLAAAGESLRSLVSGGQPLPSLDPELSALGQRAAWLLAAPPVIRSGTGPAPLPVGDAPMIADVVELLLHAVLAEGGPARAQVALEPSGEFVRITLTLTPATAGQPGIGDEAAARTGLADVAYALGARASAVLTPGQWDIEIDLPRGWRPVPGT